jgi:hypothetical protein
MVLRRPSTRRTRKTMGDLGREGRSTMVSDADFPETFFGDGSIYSDEWKLAFIVDAP